MHLFATSLQLLAETTARLKPSQKDCGPARRATDLTDDRQIQGKWIDPILQEPELRELIKLDPIPRVKPDKVVQPTGQLEICNSSESMSAALKVHSLEGCMQRESRRCSRHIGTQQVPNWVTSRKQYLNSMPDTRTVPDLDHVLLLTRLATLLCEASQLL